MAQGAAGPGRGAGGTGEARAAAIVAALAAVRGALAVAAERGGRPADAVRLVAVTKGFPLDDVWRAQAAGVRDFGENRVQEALPKVAALPAARWHFIGQLQRRKSAAVAGRFALVHSVDRPELADSLSLALGPGASPADVLLQVNLTGVPGQGGVAPAQAASLLRHVLGLGRLRPRGLMTIAPLVPVAEGARPVFAALRTLRDRLQEEEGVALPELSMGMSADFEVAVEEGATLVRLGRVLFGVRA